MRCYAVVLCHLSVGAVCAVPRAHVPNIFNAVETNAQGLPFILCVSLGLFLMYNIKYQYLVCFYRPVMLLL